MEREGEWPIYEALDHPLPNERMRWLMLAIQREMGSYGLPLLLRQAGLDRYVGRLPPADRRLKAQVDEYARLVQAMRTYYGLGARGAMLRIGREVFRRQLAARPVEAFFERLRLRLLPLPRRRLRALQSLAERMAWPEGDVSVQAIDSEVWLIDRSAHRTLGQKSDGPSCWIAVGEIAEALLWATGVEHLVEEKACRAAGDDCCRFLIQQP
ncbi:MAG: hypothetical protein AB1449_04910 [Chloroflexota bacterium]